MAKKSTKFIALLLTVLMVITLLPMSVLAEAGDSGLTLNKRVSQNGDGTYKLTLDAYGNGSATTTTTTSTKPTDIILVLDQSGSMSEGFSSTTTTTYTQFPASVTNYDMYEYYSNGIYVKINDQYKQVTIAYSTDDSTDTYTYTVDGQTWTATGPYEGDGSVWDAAPPVIPAEVESDGHYYEASTSTSSVSKLDALKTAVTNFIGNVQKNAKDNNVDHRIAIVGFATDNTVQRDKYQNTELLSTTAEVNYSNAKANDYSSALVSANSSGAINSALTTAVGRLDANGGTATDLGMTMANNILYNTITSAEGRNRVVVVFTDGIPGISSMAQDSTRTNYANRAITAAKAIKDSGAKIFTVGVFNGADATSPFDTTTNDWSNDDTPNRFMNYLSSNYPVATSMSNGGTRGEGTYYMAASNTTTLNSVFEQISNSITTPTSSTTLGTSAVLKDIVTNNFTLNTSVAANDVKVYTVPYTGNSTWGTRTALSGATVTISGNTVNVSGFDYAGNCVWDKDGNHGGSKLEVEITIKLNPDVELPDSSNKVNTNTDDSGIYDGNTKVDSFVSPQVSLYEVTYVDGDNTLQRTTVQSGMSIPSFTGTTPTKTGYTFNGWHLTAGTEATGSKVGTTNLTYTAQWAPRNDLSYTINYYKDSVGTANKLGDTVTVGSQTFGDSVTLTETQLNAQRPEGYAAGVSTPTAVTIAVSGNNFNVVYQKNSYTVTYLLDGAAYTVAASYAGDHVYNSTVTVAPQATKSGYSTTAWTTSDATVINGTFTMPAKNVVFTATSKGNTVIVIPPDTPVTDIPEEPVPEALNSTDHFVYVVGYPDGNVKPGGNITRAEVTTMFYRLLTADSRDAIFTSVASFSDMNASMWYNKAVASMAKGNYVTGYPNGTFGGNKKITRAEFVAIAARFMDAKDGTVTFTDVSSSNWAYQYIATAVSYGWITGYADGTFKPNQYITRAEAITIINRMLNRGVDAAGLIEGFKAWPDNISGQWYYYDVIEATNDHEYTGARPSEVWSSLTTTYSYDIVKYEHP